MIIVMGIERKLYYSGARVNFLLQSLLSFFNNVTEPTLSCRSTCLQNKSGLVTEARASTVTSEISLHSKPYAVHNKLVVNT